MIKPRITEHIFLGIAAAESNNLYGIAGAAPNIKMLNLRAFDPGGLW